MIHNIAIIIALSITIYCIHSYIESQKQFVFGYGSLMIDDSRYSTIGHETIGHSAYLSPDFNYLRKFILLGPRNNFELSMAYNTEHTQKSTGGVLFKVGNETLHKLDIRESAYKRIIVPVTMIQSDGCTLHPNNKVWMYVNNIEQQNPVMFSTKEQISYINRLMEACYIYGDEFMMNFISSTHGWNMKWLEYSDIHEMIIQYKQKLTV